MHNRTNPKEIEIYLSESLFIVRQIARPTEQVTLLTLRQLYHELFHQCRTLLDN